MPRLRPAYITVASRKGRAPTKGSWAKGKSGNPNGRPKPPPDELELRRLCREASPAIFTRLLAIATKSKDVKASIRASEVILDRGYGRPRQELDIKADVDVKVDPREALARALDRIATRAGEGDVAGKPEPGGG